MITIRKWLQTISEATQVIEIDIRLAGESAKASMELVKKARDEGLRKPGFVDAIVLATARVCRSQVLTGDCHFKGLPETMWLEEGSGLTPGTLRSLQ